MSQVSQVKEASDIVEIIGERIQVSRAGSNLKALCPFHSEKTPSFFINEQLQRYRCFGCGERGDVFDFLEKYEGLTFAEALKYLADRANISLTEFKPSAQDNLRERLFHILDQARSYYHYVLTEHKLGQLAREYLKDRGITNESIKVFQLGYALPGWDHLISYLHKKKKFSLSDLEQAGLILKGRTGRQYDRFRNRIMFPLTNHRGKVVGFSGRVLDAEAKEAKYINTPETMIYHKSELLYGYSQLYQHIRKAGEVIVAEGEMDVISSAQAHVNTIVAIKGSALTTEQLKLLNRTVDRVLLSLDMDDAGIEATKRAITLAKEFVLELRVIQIPGGKDPDELARSDPKAWREASKTSISVYEFFLQHALRSHDQNTPEGKRKIMASLAPVMNQITHAVELDFYVKKLATALQVTDETVKQDLRSFAEKQKVSPRAKTQSATQQKPAEPTRQHKLERYVIFLVLRLLESGLDNKDTVKKHLKTISWQTTGLQQVVDELLGRIDKFGLAQFTRSLGDDLQQLVADIYLDPEFVKLLDQVELNKEWQRAMKELRKIAISTEIDQITQQLNTLDSKREKSEEDELR